MKRVLIALLVFGGVFSGVSQAALPPGYVEERPDVLLDSVGFKIMMEFEGKLKEPARALTEFCSNKPRDHAKNGDRFFCDERIEAGQKWFSGVQALSSATDDKPDSRSQNLQDFGLSWHQKPSAFSELAGSLSYVMKFDQSVNRRRIIRVSSPLGYAVFVAIPFTTQRWQTDDPAMAAFWGSLYSGLQDSLILVDAQIGNSRGWEAINRVQKDFSSCGSRGSLLGFVAYMLSGGKNHVSPAAYSHVRWTVPSFHQYLNPGIFSGCVKGGIK
mgnify:CR=1 FL=1